MSDRICFESRRVGRIELSESDVLTFEPIPGFPGKTRFVVMEHTEESEMAWLVSLDDPDLAFVVSTPWSFFPTYDPPVEREHLAALGIEKLEEVEILSILSVSEGKIFFNLAAPLLINASTRRGMQVVADDPRYTTRVAIPALEERVKDELASQESTSRTSVAPRVSPSA